MKSVFDPADVNELLARIDALTPGSRPLWGKMNVAQMLAHCNVTYEFVYDNTHPRPNWFARLMLKLFVKSTVVNDKPYRHNLRTNPVFLVTDEKSFAAEKERLVGYVKKTLELGQPYFEQRESNSFGPLSGKEWNNTFYKHLDHHLRQFGA